MATNKRVATELRLIRVVSKGHRDVVYLRHNNLRIFGVTCEPGKSSRVRVNRRFYAYDRVQWRSVFDEYVDWKRVMMPAFRLPNFSGRMKTGETHPWRKPHHPRM